MQHGFLVGRLVEFASALYSCHTEFASLEVVQLAACTQVVVAIVAGFVGVAIAVAVAAVAAGEARHRTASCC